MRRFSFRLERLLNIKKHNEEEAKLRYSKELQKKIALETENRTMKETIQSSLAKVNPEIRPGDKIDIISMNQLEKYITNAEKKIKLNNKKKEELEKKLEVLKLELEKATRERKIIDKLKSRKHENYKKEVKKEEIKYIDEIAGHMKK